jgi:Ca-activated chloride channel family protein
MEIVFENPAFLWFLAFMPLLVAIHLYSLHYVRQKAMRFANFEALEKIVQGGGSIVPKNYALLVLRVIALMGFTLAAAGMTVRYETTVSQFDYMVAIDTSSSMLAQDFTPNRMVASREAAADWVASLPPHSEAGVVGFSTQAIVLAPLSEDLAGAKASLSNATTSKSGGTAICEAIRASTNELISSERAKAIVLLSDGQNNAGCLLDEGINYAKSNGVIIFAIGVGSSTGGDIGGSKDLFFTLDEDGLRRAAVSTGGDYARAQNAQELRDAFANLTATGTKMQALKLGIYFMFFAFILVFIDWGLSITRYRSIP